MAELTTAARPYARAAFETAQAHGRLAEWSQMLAFMAALARDPTLHALLDSPRLSTTQAGDLFISVCRDNVDEQGQNFIRLLAENRRLVLLPEVAVLFEQYRADAEGKIEAEIISAQEVEEAQLAAITRALKARLGREVTLKWRSDPSLLGGAVIRAGDLVIDGSIRGRLNKLSRVLIH